MFLAQVPKIFLRLGPKIFTNFTSFKNIFIMAKCDDDYDDVMAAKGRHLMAAYGQQTLGNFHSSPNSLLRNKNMSILLPKNVNALFTTQKNSICLLPLWPQSNFIGTCEVSWGSSSTKWHIYVISELHRGTLKLCED